jgi:hypothetical protein
MHKASRWAEVITLAFTTAPALTLLIRKLRDTQLESGGMSGFFSRCPRSSSPGPLSLSASLCSPSPGRPEPLTSRPLSQTRPPLARALESRQYSYLASSTFTKSSGHCESMRTRFRGIGRYIVLLRSLPLLSETRTT